MAMARPTLPVTLHVGGTTAEVGTVEVPFTPRPIDRWNITLEVDHAEFRRRLADLLRGVADEFEKGAPDGD